MKWLALVLVACACAGPTDPCAEADYVLETPMYTATGDSIVGVVQICVTGPIVAK